MHRYKSLRDFRYALTRSIFRYADRYALRRDSGERCERCRWQIQRAERVAGVGERRSRFAGKESTGHPNRNLYHIEWRSHISILPKGKNIELQSNISTKRRPPGLLFYTPNTPTMLCKPSTFIIFFKVAQPLVIRVTADLQLALRQRRNFTLRSKTSRPKETSLQSNFTKATFSVM